MKPCFTSAWILASSGSSILMTAAAGDCASAVTNIARPWSDWWPWRNASRIAPPVFSATSTLPRVLDSVGQPRPVTAPRSVFDLPRTLSGVMS